MSGSTVCAGQASEPVATESGRPSSKHAITMITQQVRCEKHGLQDETSVCQHIVASLRDGVPRGFHWPEDSKEERPDARCSECHDAGRDTLRRIEGPIEQAAPIG